MVTATLTSEERAVITARLSEAESAYHALMTGTSARVVVDGLSSERVEFTSANSDKLNSYITKMKVQLGLLAAPCLTQYGPAGFYF